MIWFVLIAVITIAIVIYFSIKDDDVLSGIAAGLPTLLLGSFLALMTNALSAIYTEEYQSEPQRLVNLQDGSEVNGSFFLGIGSVGEDMKYSFYGEVSPGVYKLRTADADRSKVTFTNEEPFYTLTCDRPIFSKWVTVFHNDIYCRSNEITFHVPKGSIDTEFNLDAK